MNRNSFSYENIKCICKGKEIKYKALDLENFIPKNIGKTFIILFRTELAIEIIDKQKIEFFNRIGKKVL